MVRITRFHEAFRVASWILGFAAGCNRLGVLDVQPVKPSPRAASPDDLSIFRLFIDWTLSSTSFPPVPVEIVPVSVEGGTPA